MDSTLEFSGLNETDSTSWGSGLNEAENQRDKKKVSELGVATLYD